MLDRSVAPPLNHTLDFELPKFERFLEKNGLTGVLIPSNRQEVVRVEFLFPAGKIYEPRPLVSHFTTTMLEKGTLRHSAQQIAGIFDFYSAHLEISPGYDYSSIGLVCLTQNLKKVLPLLLEILHEPAFDESELRISKEIFTQNLQINLEKNAFVAGQNIRKLVFGDHPYGLYPTLSSVDQVNRELLLNFFKVKFNPEYIFISGKIENPDLKYIQDHFHAPVTPFTETPLAPAIQAPARDHIDKSNSVQSSIRIARRSIDRTHRDYTGLILANHMLGGFFGSRLMKHIREEKGLTYGIYSAIQHMQHAVIHSIGADVNKENLDAALEAINFELRNLADFSKEELTTAKHHLIGSIQLDVNTIFAAAEKVKLIFLNKLPENFIAEEIKNIDNLSVDEVRRAAEAYFQPDQFSIATVG
jgi:zinc protease